MNVADLVKNAATGKWEARYDGRVISASNSKNYIVENIRTGRCNKANQYKVSDVQEKPGAIMIGENGERTPAPKSEEMSTPAKRVQLDLPEKSLARLQTLKAKTEASSYADVIKNALRLYETVITEVEAGNSLVLEKPDGQKEKLRFI